MSNKNMFDSFLKKLGMESFDFESLGECMNALSHQESSVRIAALESISRKHFKYISDISPIISVMHGDENLQAQEIAITILGDIGSEACMEALMEMLSFRDQWLRVRAALALSQFSNPRAYKAIVDSLGGIKSEYHSTISRAIAKQEAMFGSLRNRSGSLFLPESRSETEARPLQAPTFPQSVEYHTSTEDAGSYTDDGREGGEEQVYELDFSDPLLNNRSSASPPPSHQFVNTGASLYESAMCLTHKKNEKILFSSSAFHEFLAFQLSKASNEADADAGILALYHKAFTENDASSVKSLISLVWSEKEALRFQAIQALSGLPVEGAVADLFMELLSDPSPDICFRAIAALSCHSEKAVAEKMLSFVASPHEQLKKMAQQYFLIHGSLEMADLIVANFSGRPGERPVLASLIARMDLDEVKTPLKRLLQDFSTEESVVTSILEKLPPRHRDVVIASLPVLLQRREESVFMLLVRFLSDPDDLIVREYLRSNMGSASEIFRGRCAYLLGLLKDEGASGAVAALLADEKEYVRLQAAKALRLLNASRYAHQLQQSLMGDPSTANRLEYVRIIDDLFGNKALTCFVNAMKSSPMEVRCLILELCSRRVWQPNESAVLEKIAQSFLGEKDMRLVFYSLVLLVKLGVRRFSADTAMLTGLLEHLLRDSRNPEKIRREALFCFHALSPSGALKLIKSIVKSDPDRAVRMQCLELMAGYPPAEVGDLLVVLSRTAGDIGFKAAEILQQQKSRS